MNHYELLCIISGKMTELEISECEKSIENMLKSVVSTVHFAHHLDRKKLAFPIDHHAYGYYFLVVFDAEKQTISRIERELTLMNDVLRHSIAQKKSISSPPIAERKQAFDALPSIEEMPSDIQPTQSPVIQAEVTVAPNTPIPVEIKDPVITPIEKKAPEESIAVQTPVESIEPAVENDSTPQKKKQTKLSYEELDKRLDEIINNDIF